ncbi:MAG: hypothetical protein NZM11_05265 [Anaerolineales bacterium]|nr:hypothetical protein [Anaerolineales bacterium]
MFRSRALLILPAVMGVVGCGVLGGLGLAHWLRGAAPSPLGVTAVVLGSAPSLSPPAVSTTAPPTPFFPPTLTPVLPSLTPTLRPNPALTGKIVFTGLDGNDDEICLLRLADMSITQLTHNDAGDW